MLRFFLLRFLPRRLLPLLALVEIIRLVRRWQTRDDPTMRARARAEGADDLPSSR